MIEGVVYGIALNDRDERIALTDAFGKPPYQAPPTAPVVFIKPRACQTFEGAPVPVPDDLGAVRVAATILLVFGPEPGVPVAAALALSIAEPHDSYYRPAIRQQCRDGFLPIGAFAEYRAGIDSGDIVTRIDGVEAHRWSLDRLVRPIETLIADLQAFMSLADGDALLVGLAGDAPTARIGQEVTVEHPGFAPLRTRLVEEVTA